jgi:nucleotidyltransferase-like protein
VSLEPPALTELGSRLSALGWVSDLWVAGSLATGDYLPGVSDLDLVAVVDGAISDERRSALAGLHRDLDTGGAAGLDLGSAYVDASRLLDADALHPTWTHGALVHRILSGVTRAELVRHGYALLGRDPSAVLPPMSDDDVREAARAEVTGYWAWASRRPRLSDRPDRRCGTGPGGWRALARHC